MCDLKMSRFGLWAFYGLDILFYGYRMFYHWIVYGTDGESNHLIDAIFFTLLIVGFWLLGFYSTKKRNYFGNISDWATDTEVRCMYFVCLPGGLLFRNFSADAEIRDFAAPFELYFWRLYTIYNCTVSILTILVSLAQGLVFNAFFVSFFLALYLWAYYTLTKHAKPGQRVEAQIQQANLSAEDQRAIVYGHPNNPPPPSGIYSDPNNVQPTYAQPPPTYAMASDAERKVDFKPIQIRDEDKGGDNMSPVGTGTGTYDQQGLIAPTNA